MSSSLSIIAGVFGLCWGLLVVMYLFSKKKVFKDKQTNHHLEWVKWFLVLFAILFIIGFLFFVLPYTNIGM